MKRLQPAGRCGGKALAIAAAVVTFALPLAGCKKEKTVKLYAGAGLRYGVEDLLAEFEKQTGISIEPDYGGSGMIRSRAQLDAEQDKEGDLFMPGDVSYVDELAEKGLIESRVQVAHFVPVIIVRKGNPKNIKKLEDFFREDVTPAIGNPSDSGPAVGRLCVRLFANYGRDVTKLKSIQSLTVNELGNWVATGHADAAVVWRAIALNHADDVDIIEIPKDKNVISSVVVGLMKTSGHKAEAKKFMDFMASEKGRSILRNRGYQIEAP